MLQLLPKPPLPFTFLCKINHQMYFSFSAAVFLFIFSDHFSPSFSQDDVTFPNCNQTFSCGQFTNITYPFSGGLRPDYCGHSSFRLTCNQNVTEFTTNQLTYRVLQLNQSQQTLTLARSDLWDTTCTSQFINSTFDSSNFTPNFMNSELTIIYGCDSSPNLTFSCTISGTDLDSYYIVGPVPTDPILRIFQCQVSISLWTLSGDNLTGSRITLGEALREGFMVNYSDPYSSQCSDCNDLGGQCGFESSSGEPVCICEDRICNSPVTNGSIDEPPNNATSNQKIVLPIIGAILGGIIFGWVVFFCRQRKKRHYVQTIIKAISSSFASNKAVICSIPSLNFTKTKSELEKSNTYFGVQVFAYKELVEATNNFNYDRELGEGGFGTVYYGKLSDGREVAVKRAYENSVKRLEQFMNEVEIIARLHHQYLVKLYGCTCKTSHELLLVYEYIPNGTMADHLHGNLEKTGFLTWQVRLNIAKQTAEALLYLHESGIIHRDVKSNNILLDSNLNVKVADFGLSRLFQNDKTHISTAPQGTPGYVDPEYHQCYHLTDKSDVYSFGVVLVELISSLKAVDTNRYRHDINLANMAVDKIQNRSLSELVDSGLGFDSDESVKTAITLVAEVAFRCLQGDRDLRPSMKEVLDNLKAIKNDDAIVMEVSDDDSVSKDSPPPSPCSVVSTRWVSDSSVDSTV